MEYEGLTFDDVLLVPRYSEIKSRLCVDLGTRLTKDIRIANPLISANMDTVTEAPMMAAMRRLNCIGILHRYMGPNKANDQIEAYQDLMGNLHPTLPCVSIGVNSDAEELLDVYFERAVSIICIDIAHGHCDAVIKMIERVKNKGNFQVIAGNVATREGAHDLCKAGADAIKVGIGPGSICSTRLITGNGVPQLSAIEECVLAADEYNVPVIADGGIRTSGDMVKALAVGASTVMIGSLLSGTDETPGEKEQLFNKDGDHVNKFYKVYRGMASKDAMTGWKGPDYHATPEGVTIFVKCKGPVENTIKGLLAGIRSGLAYQGAKNLLNLRDFATFRRVSPNCLIENSPHGK